jgi:crossover junction endodeoxyribonuclease RuvC
VVVTNPATALPERLRALHAELRALVGELHPDVVVVERVFFQTNARTAMATGQASGLALMVAADSGCEVVQYTANEVKMAVCGYGAASKAQVQRMVTQLLQLAEVPRPPDVADALALAVCHLTAAPFHQAVAAAMSRRPAPATGAGEVVR